MGKFFNNYFYRYCCMCLFAEASEVEICRCAHAHAQVRDEKLWWQYDKTPEQKEKERNREKLKVPDLAPLYKLHILVCQCIYGDNLLDIGVKIVFPNTTRDSWIRAARLAERISWGAREHAPQ